MLLSHALSAVAEAGAREAVIAVNDRDADAVVSALRDDAPPIPFELMQRTTASSFETFAFLAPRLRDESHALVAMVDGVFEPALTRLGLPRERVAVVGDRADRDLEAALAAGLRAVWVCGDHPPSVDDERLRSVHAVLVSVDDLDPKADP